MRSSHSRRALLRRGAVAVALATAGCSATNRSGGTTPSTTSQDDAAPGAAGTAATVTPSATTARTTRTSVPRSRLSDESAGERALAAEEAFLAERFRAAPCLDSWGTTPTTTSEEATVVDRTAAGVTVEVRHPYWFSTANAEADGASEARYLVAPGGARRIRGDDDLVPC